MHWNSIAVLCSIPGERVRALARKLPGIFILSAAAVICFALPEAKADWAIRSINTGTNPSAVAINPVTNRIYVANEGSNSVTVIDRAADTTTTVPTDSNPCAMALNPVTNKIYVLNRIGKSVTVIDGATNATTRVKTGTMPKAIAVNPVTNKIYVTNSGSFNVTVIDGATNDTAMVAADFYPFAIAVNPVTNKIYVGNFGSNIITVIDGATRTTTAITSITAGTEPQAIAINPVTNKVYVANYGSNNVTVIDGATNGIATVPAGTIPWEIAVDPAGNKIYVTNSGSGNVTVIDGVTNDTTLVAAGVSPYGVAVNPVNNKIYVTNNDSTVTVINGADYSATKIKTGTLPQAIAVNPVTGMVYAANSGDNTVTEIDGSTSSVTTISTGSTTPSVAVNPVTGKSYVANTGSNTITVIDGKTNSTTTLPAGTYPGYVAVNPVTDKIYVTNAGSNSVTVIDGKTNTTTAVATGVQPGYLAVNPVTNKIYVTNLFNTVSVIDGATNATSTVNVGSYPQGIAVNPATNKIYVVNKDDNSVTIIGGLTNATTTIGVGSSPENLAINPATNKIYVLNTGGNTVTVIDGETNGTTTVSVGTSPCAVAVNPVTNKIYVANKASSTGSWGTTITVIDGKTNQTTTVPTGKAPNGVAVNPVTNKIYVTNAIGNSVTVIDGTTNLTTSLPVGIFPEGIAVDPVINKVYVANYNGNSVSIFAETETNDTKVRALPDSLPSHACYFSKPDLTGNGVNRAFAGKCGIQGIFNRVGTAQQVWNQASITSMAGTDSTRWSFTWGTDSLIFGENFLCMYAADSQCATTNNLGMGTPFTGNTTIYPIYRLSSIPSLSLPLNGMTNVPLSTTLSWGSLIGNISYGLQVSTASDFSAMMVSQSGITLAQYPLTGLTVGATYYWRANATINSSTSDWSGTWSFTAVAYPGTPGLSLPINNRADLPPYVTLSWNPGSGGLVTSYQVQLSNDNFATTVFSWSGVTGTSLVAGPLSGGTIYYWRVNASGPGGGPSSWSTVRRFLTTAAPAAPLLTSPANAAINQPLNSTLSWNSSASAVSYALQVSSVSDFTTTVFDTTGLTSPFRNVGGLAVGSLYYWRVIASNNWWSSPWSDVWSFTTIPLPPGTPTLVSPADNTPGLPASGLVLSWNSTSGGPVDSYQMQLSTDNFSTTVLNYSGITGTSRQLGAITPGATFYWRVNAANFGGTSNWSGTWTFSTSTMPGVPVLSLPDNGAMNLPVAPTLSWTSGNGAPVTGYRVQLSTDNFNTTIFDRSNVTGTSVAPGSLAAETQYFWHVNASGTAGTGNWSGAWVFTTGVIPSMPQPFSPANGSINQPLGLTLSWNSTASAISYSVQVSTAPAFNTTVLSQAGLTVTSLALSGLSVNTAYYWQVKATGPGGTGPWSSAVSFTTIPAPPAAPSLALPSNGAANLPLPLSLAWNSVATATSYALQLSTDSGFGSTIAGQSGLTATMQAITALPYSNTGYYWRVAAINGGGQGGWAGPWSFTTLLEAPALSSPLYGAVVPSSLTLVWTSVSSAQTYEAEISQDPGFATTVFDQRGLTSTSTTATVLNGTNYYWRVASVNGGVGSWAGAWSFTTSLVAPQLALPTNNTAGASLNLTLGWTSVSGASSYNVLVSTSSSFGSSVLSQTGLSVTALPVGGLSVGVTYIWKVRANFAGQGGIWSGAWSFTTYSVQTIPLAVGWNMKSFNLTPAIDTTSAVFGTVPSPGIFVVKDISGNQYFPSINQDAIKTPAVGKGYQIYTSVPDTLKIAGVPVTLANTPIALPTGWNMIGYLPPVNDSVRHALSGIAGSIVIVKDNGGYAYWPAFGINDLGVLRPGEGYKILLSAGATLTYPAPLSGVAKLASGSGSITLLKLPASRHFTAHAITGSNAMFGAQAVLIGGKPVPDNCEIAAYDEKGNLVGASTVLNGKTYLSVWGADPFAKQKNGLAEGESITFKLWTGSQEYPLVMSDKKPAYTPDGVAVGRFMVPEGALITKFDLSKVYPNPFRGTVKIAFDVPTINGIAWHNIQIDAFNMSGAVVREIAKGNYAAGHHTVTWNAAAGGNAGAGTYVVRMKARDFEKRMKVIMVK